MSKSRPPPVKFNSLTICTSHCLAASNGYHLFGALSCEHVCQWCERKSCLKQLWSKSCGAPHAPGPSRFCHLLLWKMGTRAGTSHHLSSMYPPDSVAFTPPLQLHSSLSQISYLAFSLNPCTRFSNGRFLARSQNYSLSPCSFCPSTIFDG